ncbi:MAG: HNH endonuclease signature motif containing protein [Nanoarchaeota archaeon]
MRNNKRKRLYNKEKYPFMCDFNWLHKEYIILNKSGHQIIKEFNLPKWFFYKELKRYNLTKSHKDAHKGQTMTREARNKISNTLKIMYANGQREPPMKNKKHSIESKRKISIGNKGKNKGRKRPDVTLRLLKIPILNRKEQALKMGLANKGQTKYPQYNNYDFLYREYIVNKKSCKQIAKELNIDKSLVWYWLKNHNLIRSISEAKKGIPMPLQARLKLSRYWTGRIALENNPNWQGGISFEPYTPEFNKRLKEYIRQKYSYLCQLCFKSQNGLRRKLSIHHIDYNKKNCSENNLIPLCDPCHSRTHNNRSYWLEFFDSKCMISVLEKW